MGNSEGILPFGSPRLQSNVRSVDNSLTAISLRQNAPQGRGTPDSYLAILPENTEAQIRTGLRCYSTFTIFSKNSTTNYESMSKKKERKGVSYLCIENLYKKRRAQRGGYD